MSNAFDLERAKAGEDVECQALSGKWFSCHFVGASKRGRPVVQFSDGDVVFETGEGRLRMAPKKVKVRYRNYVLKNSVHLCVSMIADAPGYETPEVIERKSWFKCWIHTDWQEVEVPQ